VIGQITPDGSLGARVGAFYSVIAVASLVGTPIGGALIVDKEKKEGYQWLILFSVSRVQRSLKKLRLTKNRERRSYSVRCSCWQAACCMIGISRNGGEVQSQGGEVV
jgi:hypothetical protein